MRRFPRAVSLALSGRGFAAIAFGAFILVACQSAGFGTNPSALGMLGQSGLHSASESAPNYIWKTYSPPSSYGANILITGISNNKGSIHIVGVDYAKAGATYSSFVAHLPDPTTGDPAPTPDAPTPEPPQHNPADVYLSAVSDLINSPYVYSAGYLTSGGSPAHNCPTTNGVTPLTCGFVYSVYPTSSTTSTTDIKLVDGNEGKNACAQTVLYGTMDANIQVGYYLTGNASSSASCAAHAVEEYMYPKSTCSSPPCVQWIDFHFPSSWGVSSSKAYGMNQFGDVVGSYTTSGSSFEIGWEFQDFNYNNFQYHTTINPTYLSTEPRDISFDRSVVGSYVDAAGKQNGFLFYKMQTWYQEDYNNSTSFPTVVYGTDDPAYLVGAYKANGVWNGFIATCQKGNGEC